MYIHKKTPDLLKNSGSDFNKVLLYITWHVIHFMSIIHRKTDLGNSLVNDKKKENTIHIMVCINVENQYINMTSDDGVKTRNES